MKRRPQDNSTARGKEQNHYAAAEVRKDRQITSEVSSRSKGKTNGTRKAKKKMTPKKIILTIVIVLICLLLVGAGAAYAYMKVTLGGINYSTETIPSQYNPPTESLENPIPVVPGITNILLLGVDNRDSDEINERSDSMMILTIDTINNKIKLTSVQRDMLVYIPGRTAPNKINSANVYGGPALAMRVVNETFRLNIEKYVLVNMSNMESIIDLANGIDVSITDSEFVYVNYGISDANYRYPTSKQSPFITVSGMQHLDGRQAVAYARIRHVGSDYGRMARQRTVLQALFSAFKAADLVTKNNLLQEGVKLITTNMTADELMTIGLGAVPLIKGEIEQLQLPITGTFHSGYLNGKSWVNWCDYNKMIPELQKFIYGKTFAFDPVKLIPEDMVTSSQTQETTATTAPSETTVPTTLATESTAPSDTTESSETTETTTSDPIIE